MIPIIGVGSFTFHALATRWAEWADVIPILVFMLMYFWLAMTRFFSWPVLAKLPILLAFLFITLALEAGIPATVLWGGCMYVPTLVALLAMGAAPARWVTKGARSRFLLVIPVFVLAFTLRTLDAPLCTSLPIGTHFLWHVFNAIFLYLLARAAILHGTSEPRPEIREGISGTIGVR